MTDAGRGNSTLVSYRAFAVVHGQRRRSIWDRGTCPPNIYEGEDIHGNVPPPNILEVMLFKMSARVTATVVCCILMQILEMRGKA